jgi:hypothetical protein
VGRYDHQRDDPSLQKTQAPAGRSPVQEKVGKCYILNRISKKDKLEICIAPTQQTVNHNGLLWYSYLSQWNTPSAANQNEVDSLSLLGFDPVTFNMPTHI